MNDIIAEARTRLELAQTEEGEFRDKFVEDLRFVYEDDGQWESHLINARQQHGRPAYTFNRTEGAIDQIVGDQRQSRPSIKIRAAEGGDKDTAETLSGLIRNILNISDFETTQDNAFTFQVAGGFGAWRIVHDYNADDSFEQDIEICEIANPLSVYFDPAATDICKRDAMWCIVTDHISKIEFSDTYDENPSSFEAGDDDWFTDDRVRIAEYYRKVIRERTLLKLSDGRVAYEDEISDVLDELAEQGITVADSRNVNCHSIEWYKLYGGGVLEGPITYDWKHIPVVPVYGKRINIEGEYHIKGLTRNAKDPQRSYNYIRSVMTEKALLAPKFSYILTPEQIKGFEDWWNDPSRAETYILANSDATAGGMPQREQPSPVPVELVTIAQMDADDIKSATGYFDASLGQQGNETSGKAILARQREGDVGSYVYIDNLAKAIRYTGEILVDMIPRIYDTERVVRILGEDGKDESVVINQTVLDEESGRAVIVNDVTQGKYDVAVTVGPSYTTLRQESSERLIGLAGQDPAMLPMARDIIIKNMDIPGGDELESRFRKQMISQGIIEPSAEEMENIPQGPDPVQVLTLEKLQAEIQKLNAQVEDLQASAQKKTAEAIETAAGVGITADGIVAKVGDLSG